MNDVRHYAAPKSMGLGDSKGERVASGSSLAPLVRFFGIFLAETRKIPAGGNPKNKQF